MKKLTKLYSLLILLLAFQACDSKDEVTPQVQWEKIEFPGQGAIYSIHGSLEDGLLLGTSKGVLKVTDNGKSSREVLRADQPISNLIKEGDIITAVTITKDYTSSDGGETWQESDKPDAPLYDMPRLYDSQQNIYYHLSLSNGPLATPSLILKSTDNGTNWENIFPFKHYVYSMYLDNKDRLYLGINGWEWDGESFNSNSNTTALAILYYMKK